MEVRGWRQRKGSVCLPSISMHHVPHNTRWKGLLHPGVYSKTAAEIWAAASGPRTSAPAGKYSFKCTVLPSPFRKIWRLIQEQLEVISVNGICTQRQYLLWFHTKPSAVDITLSLSTSLSCPSGDVDTQEKGLPPVTWWGRRASE